MMDGGLMTLFRNRIYRRNRGRGRNTKMVWLLTKVLRWTPLDLPVSSVALTGGFTGQYRSLEDAFSTNDRGIEEMKNWCSEQCRKRWRYEPPSTFIFQSKKDAAIFKLRFYE
jgi:hypothetical protein